MLEAALNSPLVQLVIAPVALRASAAQVSSAVLRIVDELDKPLGRKLIGEPLHALAAGRPHLGDLRHG
jgi:hypothetical protein